jgi:hypothetical protein
MEDYGRMLVDSLIPVLRASTSTLERTSLARENVPSSKWVFRLARRSPGENREIGFSVSSFWLAIFLSTGAFQQKMVSSDPNISVFRS